jgi:hypothetical protein
LWADDLKDLGVRLGHRRKLLAATAPPRFSRTIPDLSIPPQRPCMLDEADAMLADCSDRPRSRPCAPPARWLTNG